MEFFTSLKTLFKCHNFNIVLKLIPSFYFGGIWKNICTTRTYTIYTLNNTFYLIFSSKPYFICNDKIISAYLISQRRQWHPTPVLLPGKSHGWRSLVGCSPWGRWGSDTTEQLNFHFSLSCIGEGNGNPLQCSCLENPRDIGAWWAAVYGVAQSQKQLKWLSSSSILYLITRNWNFENLIECI